MLLFPSLAPPLTTLQTGAGIYFTRGGGKPFSDHPCTPKAPPEPYRKGSSAPAIISNAKAVRPPHSSSDRLQGNKQHTDVGSFQQSLKETQDPKQKYAQLASEPQGWALLPRAGGTPVLTRGTGTGSTAATAARHPSAFLPLLYTTASKQL